MAVIVQPGRLTLTGYVGEPTIVLDGVTWFDGFTHGEVLAALGEFEDDEAIIVHINSGGGYATEGAAIRAALAERTGRTDVFVEGVAASAASLIAMSGETITMATDAVMMVHDPAGFTFGTASDHEATVRALNSLGGAYARSYARKSGKSVSECREIMRVETWFNADEAVAAGFADAIEGEAKPVAAFPYQTYARAPQRLVALATENAWRVPAMRAAATAAKPAAQSAATNRQTEEVTMTDKTAADSKPAETVDVAAAQASAVRADRERRAAIMALAEAKGRETLAEHLYASTEMDVDAVKACLAAAPATVTTEPEAARMASAGLGGAPTGKPQLRVDIVAAARQRAAA